MRGLSQSEEDKPRETWGCTAQNEWREAQGWEKPLQTVKGSLRPGWRASQLYPLWTAPSRAQFNGALKRGPSGARSPVSAQPRVWNLLQPGLSTGLFTEKPAWTWSHLPLSEKVQEMIFKASCMTGICSDPRASGFGIPVVGLGICQVAFAGLRIGGENTVWKIRSKTQQIWLSSGERWQVPRESRVKFHSVCPRTRWNPPPWKWWEGQFSGLHHALRPDVLSTTVLTVEF